MNLFLYRQSSFTIFPCFSNLYPEQRTIEIYAFLAQMSKRYNKIGGLAPDTLRLKNGVTKRYNKIGGLAPDALRLSNGSDKNEYTGLWLYVQAEKNELCTIFIMGQFRICS